MIAEQNLRNGIYLRAEDGREFTLSVVPTPLLPFDRYDVEQQVQTMLDAFAQGEFYIRIHVYSLSPLRYNVKSSLEEIPPRWWAH